MSNNNKDLIGMFKHYYDRKIEEDSDEDENEDEDDDVLKDTSSEDYLGGRKMETKSRYEVIAEMEAKKQALIRDRETLNDTLKDRMRQVKQMRRELEDAEERMKEFEDGMEDKRKMINMLIDSVDGTLKKFTESQSQKKQ